MSSCRKALATATLLGAWLLLGVATLPVQAQQAAAQPVPKQASLAVAPYPGLGRPATAKEAVTQRRRCG